MKIGTILWDSFTQCLVEIESVSRDKNYFFLIPIWCEQGNPNRATAFGRRPSYLYKFCTPIWKDFPVSKKKIAKNPLYQFHDSESFGLEIVVQQPFYRTVEYISDN